MNVSLPGTDGVPLTPTAQLNADEHDDCCGMLLPKVKIEGAPITEPVDPAALNCNEMPY